MQPTGHGHSEVPDFPDEQSRALAAAYDRGSERWHATRTELPFNLRLLLNRLLANCPPGALVLWCSMSGAVQAFRSLGIWLDADAR